MSNVKGRNVYSPKRIDTAAFLEVSIKEALFAVNFQANSN
jgi:hypothetical protein